MRDQQLGRQLKDVASDVARLGAQAFNAGRNWLNDRRQDMHHNEHGNQHSSGSERGQQGYQSENAHSSRQGSGRESGQWEPG